MLDSYGLPVRLSDQFIYKAYFDYNEEDSVAYEIFRS